MTIIHQGIHPPVNDKDQVSALASVASIRTSVRNILFSAKTNVSVPAFSGTDVDTCPVCKHVWFLSVKNGILKNNKRLQIMKGLKPL
jgi:hypothetical protein